MEHNGAVSLKDDIFAISRLKKAIQELNGQDIIALQSLSHQLKTNAPGIHQCGSSCQQLNSLSDMELEDQMRQQTGAGLGLTNLWEHSLCSLAHRVQHDLAHKFQSDQKKLQQMFRDMDEAVDSIQHKENTDTSNFKHPFPPSGAPPSSSGSSSADVSSSGPSPTEGAPRVPSWLGDDSQITSFNNGNKLAGNGIGSNSNGTTGTGTSTGMTYYSRGPSSFKSRRRASAEDVHHPFAVDSFRSKASPSERKPETFSWLQKNVMPDQEGALPPILRSKSLPWEADFQAVGNMGSPRSRRLRQQQSRGRGYDNSNNNNTDDNQSGRRRQCCLAALVSLTTHLCDAYATQDQTLKQAQRMFHHSQLLENQLAELQGSYQTSQLSSELVKAQQQNEDLQRQLKEAKHQLQSESSMRDSLAASKAELANKVDKLEAELARYQSDLSIAESKLDDEKKFREQQAKDQQHGMSNKLEQEKQRWELRITTLQQQLADAHSKAEGLDQNQAESKKELVTLKEKHEKEIKNLQAQHEAALETARTENKNNAELVAIKKRFKDKMQALKKEMKEIEAKLEKKVEAHQALQQKYDDLKKVCGKLKRQTQQSQERRNSVEATTQAELASVQAELKSTSSRLAKCKASLDKSRKELKEWKTRAGNYKEAAEEMKEKASSASNNSDELQALKAAKTSAEKELSQIKSKYKAEHNALVRLREERERLLKHIEDERKKTAGALEKLKKEQKERESLSKELSSLQQVHSKCAQERKAPTDAEPDPVSMADTANDRKKPTSGFGRCVYDEGEYYEGMWKDHERHGQGVYVWADGRKYEGMWRNDKKHGSGFYYWADGDRYEGEYQVGKMHGTGTYFFHDGTRYEGQWEKDMSHGRGIFYYNDGARFEGTFRRDKKHGPGTMFNTDGSVYKEMWDDGRRTSSQQVTVEKKKGARKKGTRRNSRR